MHRSFTHAPSAPSFTLCYYTKLVPPHTGMSIGSSEVLWPVNRYHKGSSTLSYSFTSPQFASILDYAASVLISADVEKLRQEFKKALDPMQRFGAPSPYRNLSKPISLSTAEAEAGLVPRKILNHWAKICTPYPTITPFCICPKMI